MRLFAQFAIVLAVCLSISFVAAQNKVVVVPLGGKKCTSPMENSFTNSIGMTFNLIPAGIFTMGSPDGSGDEPAEPGRYSNETQHQVTLTKPFYMQVTEVTNKQWNTAVVDTSFGVNPSLSHKGDDYPVENVNWYEATAFATGLSIAEGLTPCYDGEGTCTGILGVNFTCTTVTVKTNCTGYRLPTEAQWEYAARAGTTTAYANPYSFDTTNTETGLGFNANLHAMGWYEFNNEGGDLNRDVPAYPSGTKPVAQKQANRWGLYDMHGNVFEWCQDWYAAYPAGSVTDPQGPTDGTNRVIRGGGWNNSARFARSANRVNYTPGFRDLSLGFRLALPPGQ